MEVVSHRETDKYLDRLPEPPESNISPMSGQKGMFRLKIGGYRILFHYRENDILVTHIEGRGQVYTKKEQREKTINISLARKNMLDMLNNAK